MRNFLSIFRLELSVQINHSLSTTLAAGSAYTPFSFSPWVTWDSRCWPRCYGVTERVNRLCDFNVGEAATNTKGEEEEEEEKAGPETAPPHSFTRSLINLTTQTARNHATEQGNGSEMRALKKTRKPEK